MRKPDRRKPRTQQILRNALLALIQEQGYEAISVRDIADHANIGRATFYTHFTDKEDLLLNTLHTVFDDLESSAVGLDVPLIAAEVPVLVFPFHHAAEHRGLVLAALSTVRGTQLMSSSLREYLTGELSRVWGKSTTTNHALSIEIVADYMTGAMLALITRGLRTNDEYAPDQMAQIFHALTAPMLKSVLAESNIA
jgi:AcrR family transcriptional regulator